MSELITHHIMADDFDAALSWELLRKCNKLGADEWTIRLMRSKPHKDYPARRFDEAMTPFSLPSAFRRQLTAYRHSDFDRVTPLWRLSSKTITALQEFIPEGIFAYGQDRALWFEDLAVFRGGELMFGVVTHEREGLLRLTNVERSEIESLGIVIYKHGKYVGP